MLAPTSRNLVVQVAGEPATRELIFTGRSLEVKV